MTRVVAVVSGGMDSTVLTYQLVKTYGDVALISFNYGQRHAKELTYANRTAVKLGLTHEIVDLTNITGLISRSTLTSDAPVPDGHYAEDNMRKTVVPNRNSIMLNIATGYAITLGADAIATAVHSGDHYIYPDCRPQFIKTLEAMLRVANEGFVSDNFRVIAPFVHVPKDEIARVGQSLNVPWDDTWSCYKGGDIHCGSCGTCFERREAFQLAGIDDPTQYIATPHYVDPR